MSGRFTTTGIPGMVTCHKEPLAPTITFLHSNGSEIVKLSSEGDIEWNNGINIDAAARAFSTAIQLGLEQKANVQKGTRRRQSEMWQAVIDASAEKGFLTTEDLQSMKDHVIIVDILKGADCGKNNTDR